MFVRFRESTHRIQVSLIETRRFGGKVHHEHIASLGSIAKKPSIADRIVFWQRLFDRLERLANRVDAEKQTKILGEVHAKVPMVVADEQQSLKIENAQADERLWSSLRDMHEGLAADHETLAADAERKIRENRAAAQNAARNADEARQRVERLKRGEDVPGGFSPPPDFERLLRDAGLTGRDITHMRLMAALPQEAVPAIARAAVKAMDREHRAAARRYARALIEELEKSGVVDQT
jgi:hypothetical protein